MTTNPVIYIVDDEEAVRTSLATLLAIHGFSTQVCRSGAEFLERVDAAKPGCAIIDLKMPGLDGISCFKRWRRRTSLCLSS